MLVVVCVSSVLCIIWLSVLLCMMKNWMSM